MRKPGSSWRRLEWDDRKGWVRYANRKGCPRIKWDDGSESFGETLFEAMLNEGCLVPTTKAGYFSPLPKRGTPMRFEVEGTIYRLWMKKDGRCSERNGPVIEISDGTKWTEDDIGLPPLDWLVFNAGF